MGEIPYILRSASISSCARQPFEVIPIIPVDALP